MSTRVAPSTGYWYTSISLSPRTWRQWPTTSGGTQPQSSTTTTPWGSTAPTTRTITPGGVSPALTRTDPGPDAATSWPHQVVFPA